MIHKKQILLGVLLISSLLVISFTSASPQITINSPENVTYDSNKILVNVSSNESVDFFIKNERTGRRIVLVEDTTWLETYLYVNEGLHDYIIWANNSNGETNTSVTFQTTTHNPIYVDSCGYLYSSDTKYILSQDISTSGSFCIYLYRVRNVTFDLNENRINAGYRTGLSVSYGSDIEIYNGEIYSNPTSLDRTRPWTLEVDGSKLKFENLTINGYNGITTWNLENVIFNNITVNSSIGFWFEEISNTYLIDSSFIWNGASPPVSWIPASAFWTWSAHSTLILENVTIEGFPDYDFYFEGAYTDVFLRNTNINISKIYYPDWVADTRFFEQHLIIVNVTDQFGVTGSCSVRVLDNGILPRLEGLDSKMETLANPTSIIYIPTAETGVGQEWINEKLVHAKSSSPPVITEYDFSNYTLTTRGWGEDNYSETTLNLTDINSIVHVNFKINTSVGGEELSTCTITQMLDLNNDGYVNILDATIILRKITGLTVSINSEKECKGINLNAF